MDERERRIGLNESVFRQVNERVEDLNRAFSQVTETMDVVCECGDASCIDQIIVSLPDYERVRSDPTLFFIVPGHQAPDVETVVEEQAGFAVVRKDEGDEAELARETDPRS
jgi:hypothetical protein